MRTVVRLALSEPASSKLKVTSLRLQLQFEAPLIEPRLIRRADVAFDVFRGATEVL